MESTFIKRTMTAVTGKQAEVHGFFKVIDDRKHYQILLKFINLE